MSDRASRPSGSLASSDAHEPISRPLGAMTEAGPQPKLMRDPPDEGSTRGLSEDARPDRLLQLAARGAARLRGAGTPPERRGDPGVERDRPRDERRGREC